MLADRVFKLLVEHAVDLHAPIANGLFLDGGEDVLPEVLVDATYDHLSPASIFALSDLGFGERYDLIVIVFFLEVFAVGEKIKELIGSLARFLDRFLQSFVKELFKEIVLPSSTPFYLDEFRGRKDWAEETEIEDVGTIIAGRHHADRDAHSRLAGLIGREKVG